MNKILLASLLASNLLVAHPISRLQIMIAPDKTGLHAGQIGVNAELTHAADPTFKKNIQGQVVLTNSQMKKVEEVYQMVLKEAEKPDKK